MDIMSQNEPQYIMRGRDHELSDCQQAKGCVKASARNGTAYTPARGFEIISIMADGYSLTAAAALMGLPREKIDEWQKRHPEFADAVKRGQAIRLGKLETDLLRARKSSVVRARKFMLEHAYRIEQRDEVASPSLDDWLESLRQHLLESHRKNGLLK
jgi:hypothetical protein